ncbi:hypothetical protein [Zunongwangia endophytica]|uniref:Uncharacterized protein n=1 Tax=Zunongwangia endophytica TaxID=1808945 RepID=A0ABV8HBN7_9FLAO|nr:hypothetical protein [Zunongwangia endophytica]MDN3594657.1 hypothetical protein [Zunongwangia endophytica]
MEKLNGANIGEFILGLAHDEKAILMNSFYRLLNYQFIRDATIRILEPKSDPEYSKIYLFDHSCVLIEYLTSFFILSLEKPKEELLRKINTGIEQGYHGTITFVSFNEPWNIEGFKCLSLNFENLKEVMVKQESDKDNVPFYCLKFLMNNLSRF